MNHGFIKVAATAPDIKVANVEFNTKEILKNIELASQNGARLIVFPELCITGYTCGDLFFQELLLSKTKRALNEITASTSHIDALIFIGLPLELEGQLYNVVATLNKGKILGFTTKTFLPNYGEHNEMRQFNPGPETPFYIEFEAASIPFGPNLLFVEKQMKDCIVSVEICEDLWAPNPPGVNAAQAGATIIANCSASSEGLGKREMRRNLVKTQSTRLISGYIYANAGEGESTTDTVYAGHHIIAENGEILSEATDYKNQIIYSEIDIKKLSNERRKNTTFRPKWEPKLWRIPFEIGQEMDLKKEALTRVFPKYPFIPTDTKDLETCCEEVLQIQALGLKKRLQHAGAKTAIIGISGGLDSTLALLVIHRTFEILGKDKKEIIAVTMPGFGTTQRTYENAIEMSKNLGTTIMDIPIKDAVLQHFKDINHSPDIHDITYENVQARERTQILMNLANKMSGLVIGTGSMSELALGWATYNGDHISMYAVNVSVPKTLIKHLVKYEAKRLDLKVLHHILDTPISPELLPTTAGQASQNTEDIIGPYELHDFFLYHMLKLSYSPSKIFEIAKQSFKEDYPPETIMKWLKIFYQRFFFQQFKRSCLPDGPKVGQISLSPRGDLKMPSDACAHIWLKDLENLSTTQH